MIFFEEYNSLQIEATIKQVLFRFLKLPPNVFYDTRRYLVAARNYVMKQFQKTAK